MRLAMIARCRERGLGTMTWELARLLEPAKVLVVRRDDVDFRDDERFPGARWAELDRHGRLPTADIRWLLKGTDVLYSAETFYDDRILAEARASGIRSALHGMWEYLPHRADPTKARPDIFLAPNPWHLAEWPQPCTLLPVPVAPDRFERRSPRRVRTIVHCAGAPAKGDRNGTRDLLEALRHVRVPMRVIIRSQTPWRPPILRGPVTLTLEPAAPNYWQVYAGADAVVQPRRYGGLSLPLQEATAQGLPVIGLAREHAAGYHHAAVVHCTEAPLQLPAGTVERARFNPVLLARALEHLVADEATVEQMSEASAAAARELAWDRLSSRYSAALGAEEPACAPSTS